MPYFAARARARYYYLTDEEIKFAVDEDFDLFTKLLLHDRLSHAGQIGRRLADAARHERVAFGGHLLCDVARRLVDRLSLCATRTGGKRFNASYYNRIYYSIMCNFHRRTIRNRSLIYNMKCCNLFKSSLMF